MCQANYCPEMLRPCAMAMPIWNALKGDHSWWAVALGFQSPTFENPVWDRLTAHRALTDSRPKTRWKKREKGRSLILNVVSTKTKLVYFPGPSTQAWDMPKWLKAFAFSRSIEDGHTGPIINLETCFNVFLLGSCKRISFNDCLTSLSHFRDSIHPKCFLQISLWHHPKLIWWYGDWFGSMPPRLRQMCFWFKNLRLLKLKICEYLIKLSCRHPSTMQQIKIFVGRLVHDLH